MKGSGGGRGDHGVWGFPACPVYDSPLLGAGWRSDIVRLSWMPFSSRWSCQQGDDFILTAAPPSLLRTSQINMLGFKAAKADAGQWVRGPNALQKAFPSPPNLFSMSPVTSLGRSFSMSRPQGPRGPPDLTHCLALSFLSVYLCI